MLYHKSALLLIIIIITIFIIIVIIKFKSSFQTKPHQPYNAIYVILRCHVFYIDLPTSTTNWCPHFIMASQAIQLGVSLAA